MDQTEINQQEKIQKRKEYWREYSAKRRPPRKSMKRNLGKRIDKEYMQKYQPIYRQEKQAPVECECGAVIRPKNMYMHKTSKKHLRFIQGKFLYNIINDKSSNSSKSNAPSINKSDVQCDTTGEDIQDSQS